MGKLMFQHCLVPNPASFLLALGGCGTLEWHKKNSHKICLCEFTILVLVDALQNLQGCRVIDHLIDHPKCSQPRCPPIQNVQ